MNLTFNDITPKYQALVWTYGSDSIHVEIPKNSKVFYATQQQLKQSKIFTCVVGFPNNSLYIGVQSAYDTLQIAERISISLEQLNLKVERRYHKAGEKEPVSVQSFILI
jgi:hypothetical protein